MNNCKECNGKGYFDEVISYGSMPEGYDKAHTEKCDECNKYKDDKLKEHCDET